VFFTNKELTDLEQEDREKVQWKISFEFSHGAYFPFRHLNAFYALNPNSLQASVSHYSKHDEGKHLFLLATPIAEVPVVIRDCNTNMDLNSIQSKKFSIEEPPRRKATAQTLQA